MNDFVFLFDMDSSLADHDTALQADLNAIRSPEEKEVALWGDEEKLPYMRARIRLIRNQPDWWLNLKPIDSGIALYDLAVQMGFTCEVLTKGPKNSPNAWREKVLWCQKHLDKDVNIHIVSDNGDGPHGGKGRVYGRVLYDDFPPYMLKWLHHRPRGLGIMPETPYNKDFNHPNVIKYDGTNESLGLVKEALKRVLARQDKEPLDLSDLKVPGKEGVTWETLRSVDPDYFGHADEDNPMDKLISYEDAAYKLATFLFDKGGQTRKFDEAKQQIQKVFPVGNGLYSMALQNYADGDHDT